MRISCHILDQCPFSFPSSRIGNCVHGARRQPPVAAGFSVVQLRMNKSNNPALSFKGLCSVAKGNQALFCSQSNYIGILGGVSVLSTVKFLERLLWWSSIDGDECDLPLIVCNDETISNLAPSNGESCLRREVFVENLIQKREFLQKYGAKCFLIPCHRSLACHKEVAEGCSLSFLHIGESVASELKTAKLRPLEAGSKTPKVGVLALSSSPCAKFYQEELQKEGFEVVLPDKQTMDHILVPAIEAATRNDREGAKILLMIAIRVLLLKAVNTVVLAADELQDLLPRDDPLLKRCIDPMDSLAKFTLMWAKDAGIIRRRT